MPATKALCIFTTLLGNGAMASRLIETLDRLPGLEPTYVRLMVEDYDTFPAPWWARATAPWQVELIARQKARQVMKLPFDLLLVNAWELVVAFRDVAHRLPAAAVMDAVPATVDAQLRQRGFKSWKRLLSHGVHHRSFAKAAREFDFFLPWGSDCADSLHRDYGVERDHCRITLAPQDLERWTPAGRSVSLPIRLLFVGNDFARKGGDFLLRLYSEHLLGSFTLTVASNDSALDGRQLPAGVQWLRGRNRDQLIEVYRDSDIFVFPTQQDYMPQVLAEALAAGLPCLANDVGGIRDLVHNGETGFLISRDAPTEVWAANLRRLAANPAELRRMSACARRFAEERLGLDRFERLIADVIEGLRAKGAEYGRRG
jgi:glycosyltransferase involved in cell wall biosynthesis